MKREWIGMVSYVVGIVLILGTFATAVDTFKRSCVTMSGWSCGTDDLIYKLAVWSITFFVFYFVYRASK